ncbi:asparaginase [Virgibacillus chiguensis]|uniref:L-asparaginase n=1 Tax=Virgibacillus chiguensis TaxID=411959 RepID=A0A1M5QP79_9BACI|nr:asparaginase [Virgibacillus chiguensis]SHH15681.1 L-asparaginase [Virgibacillus chiguensis]
MKRIKLIASGGTISGKGANRLDLKDYRTGYYKGEDLLRQVPEVLNIAQVDAYELANKSSTKMQSSDWLKLKRLVNELLNQEHYDGIVITHGTNTLEETAYFLHLTVQSGKPVVIVGAQRPFTALGSDALHNLWIAFKVAIDEQSYDKGVLVVANNEIHSAREVSKTDTYSLGTFQSGKAGALGYVSAEHTVLYDRYPTRKHTFQSVFNDNSNVRNLPEVAIVYSYAGVNEDIINFIVDSGKYSGIVLAGTGAGRCSQKEEKALKKACQKGIVVVRSSRCFEGRVVPIESFDTFPFITADNLSPQKARILLMLALTLTDDLSEIQAMFHDY